MNQAIADFINYGEKFLSFHSFTNASSLDLLPQPMISSAPFRKGQLCSFSPLEWIFLKNLKINL